MSPTPAQDAPPPALGATITEALLRPLSPSRVLVKDGMSHLAAWDVRAHLDRVFGFAEWSAEAVAMEPVYEQPTETKAGKPAWKVAYRALVVLRIHQTGATYSEWAVGEAIMPDFKRGDAHDFAIKTAESQALKRCATNLGTQFGLSLYDNGNTHDVVKGVLGHSPLSEVKVAADDAGPARAPEGPAEGTPTALAYMDTAASLRGDREGLKALWNDAQKYGLLDEVVEGRTVGAWITDAAKEDLA